MWGTAWRLRLCRNLAAKTTECSNAWLEGMHEQDGGGSLSLEAEDVVLRHLCPSQDDLIQV